MAFKKWQERTDAGERDALAPDEPWLHDKVARSKLVHSPLNASASCWACSYFLADPVPGS